LINSGSSQNNQSKSIDLSSSSKHHLTNSLSIDLSGNQFDRQAQSISISKDEKQNDHSSSSDENNDTSITSRTKKNLKSTISGFIRTKMEKYSTKTDPNDSHRSDKQLKYIFHKYSKDNQVNNTIFSNTLKLRIIFIF